MDRETDRNNTIHDGRWALRQLPPEERIDWENDYREKTIALFGREFYQKVMLKRICDALGYCSEKPSKTSPNTNEEIPPAKDTNTDEKSPS